MISWQSIYLLLEETEAIGENHQPFTSHWQTLSHEVVSGRTWTSKLSGYRHWMRNVGANSTTVLHDFYCEELLQLIRHKKV
jgi:hypothetical protein